MARDYLLMLGAPGQDRDVDKFINKREVNVNKSKNRLYIYNNYIK